MRAYELKRALWKARCKRATGMMSVVSPVSTVSDEQVSWQVRLQESRAFDKVQIAIKKVLQYLLAKTDTTNVKLVNFCLMLLELS